MKNKTKAPAPVIDLRYSLNSPAPLPRTKWDKDGRDVCRDCGSKAVRPSGTPGDLLPHHAPGCAWVIDFLAWRAAGER